MTEEDNERRKDLAHRYPLDVMRPFTDFWDELQRNMLWPWESRPWMTPRRLFTPEQWTKTPLADMIDRGDTFIVRTETPGLTKEELKIEITQDAIEISGESKQEKEEDNYRVYERSYTSIHRRLTFPEKVKVKEATAILKNGVLEVEIPKVLPSKKEDKYQVKIQ
jgi:HSP20 family protein